MKLYQFKNILNNNNYYQSVSCIHKKILDPTKVLAYLRQPHQPPPQSPLVDVSTVTLIARPKRIQSTSLLTRMIENAGKKNIMNE